MDSTQAPKSPTPSEVEEAWAGYERSLSRLSNDQLLSLLTTLNSQLQEQATSSISTTLLASLEAADRPVLSSTPTATLSDYPPMDRGVRASPQQQPGALDLLARSRRLGPRVAGKLVLAQARAARRT
jgi:hypothetical protein